MLRRKFLQASGLASASMLGTVAPAGSGMAQPAAPGFPRRFIMAGHAQPDTSFSRGLEVIGSRLTERFSDQLDVRYVFNSVAIGYAAQDLHWLVDADILTLAYSTPMSFGVPALDIAALPFVFSGNDQARAAMDGPLGAAAIAHIEANSDFRVLGFFENGFRHISNNIRPVASPADVRGLKLRVLSVQQPGFAALGAATGFMPITETIPKLADGTFDGQENPYENIVAYGAHPHQRYYTSTFHSYMSRPIFVHRPAFESWDISLQQELRTAVRTAVVAQRAQHDLAEVEALALIRAEGGEIIELTPAQRAAFVAAVEPVYANARINYDRQLLRHVGL